MDDFCTKIGWFLANNTKILGNKEANDKKYSDENTESSEINDDHDNQNDSSSISSVDGFERGNV